MQTTSRFLFMGLFIAFGGYGAACGEDGERGPKTGESSSSSSTSTTSGGGSSTSSGGGHGGSGGGAECSSEADCPDPAMDCKVADCSNGVCGAVDAPDGTPAGPQV